MGIIVILVSIFAERRWALVAIWTIAVAIAAISFPSLQDYRARMGFAEPDLTMTMVVACATTAIYVLLGRVVRWSYGKIAKKDVGPLLGN